MADDPSIPTQFGWDASDYDWSRGPMDLGAAARDGIVFFTHKATEGTGTKHQRYGEALRRARDAGIPVLGAYHVVRSSPSVSAQVDYFLSYLDGQTPWWRNWPDWFLQVDLEKWSYDKVPASAGEAFADLVEQRTGRKAVIYASRGQYGNELNGTSHLLWNANYGANIEDHYAAVYAARGGDSGAGWVTYSGRMPVFWQYGSRTRIGTQTICDANAFRGTLAQLRALISTSGDNDMADINQADWEALIWRQHTEIYDLPFVPGGPKKGERNEPHFARKAMDAKLDGLMAAIQAIGTSNPDVAAILAGVDERLAGLRTQIHADVDEELDEQSRGGADNDTPA